MKRTRWLLLPLLSTLAACAWWMAGRPGIGAVDHIIFSHELHAENGVDCDTCHDEVAKATSTKEVERYLPKMATCLECHEQENCSMCHTNPDAAQAPLPVESRISFSHARHTAMKDVTCKTCHAPVMAATSLPVTLPEMAVCLKCHNHEKQYAQGTCLNCHPSMREMPLRALGEFNHGGNWMRLHANLARVQSASCLQCHPESTCSECHSRVAPATRWQLYPEKVAQYQIHRGDWRAVHGMEARAQGALCLRCHNTQYCERCHTVQELTQTAATPIYPHPGGYALPGGPAFHGTDARLHIETCAACHDQGAASVCVDCHRVGGIGGNPHPPGWGGSHDLEDAHENKMCRICHM